VKTKQKARGVSPGHEFGETHKAPGYKQKDQNEKWVMKKSRSVR
jgi:hypothetical protein